MDVINASYRVSSWENVEELRKCYKLIYGAKATVADKTQAHQILQVWKTRRSDESLAGVLCSLSLLDVYLKDITAKITDPFTLSTLYASTLTKFINYATSFQMQESTMYRSAHKLGIESFLIDLRHLCAHGKTLPSLEVFRKSHRYCVEWIRKFFWEKEIENVSDANVKEIRYDQDLADKLNKIFPFYDTLAEIMRRNIVDFQDVEAKAMTEKRWPLMKKFMADHSFKDFRQAFKFLTGELTKVIESRLMNQNSRTFFHKMFELCEFFMKAVDLKELPIQESSDEQVEATKPKRRKKEPQSIVNTYQNLVWQIAKHDHLKLFIDMLYQLSLNDENPIHRASARFWVCTILRSFGYYQRYFRFAKDSAMQPTKVTEEIRKIYTYQFDADLKKVFIFAGTQIQPNSLKFSRDFFDQLLQNVTEDTAAVCVCLLPFVHPPLSKEQLERFHDLISIGTNSEKNPKEPEEDKIFTVDDLMELASKCSKPEAEKSNLIWEVSNDDIDWSSLPIGKNFSIQV